MKPLTDAQQRLLEAIRHHWHTYSHAPTLIELATVLGYPSQANVTYHLSGLARAGLATWDDNSSRTIKVVGETYADLVNRIDELTKAEPQGATHAID